jgi:pimeloyl-ACP methyl ester carboxylesterase
LIAGIALALTCCSGARDYHLHEAETIGRSGGLSALTVQAEGVTLLGFERAGPADGTLTVYIEGDGRAWTNPWQPSTDPTPTDPIGLRLAAADPARPLIYLARPCQFEPSAGCDSRLWTSARLSPQVIRILQRLIDEALRRTGSKRLGLIGYSGGGALAALIAERRHDVAWLVTVAADIDLAEWVRLNGLEPLSNSLDPADNADAIRLLPQIHLTGSDDPVVPPTVAQSFLQHFAANGAARVIVVPGFDHSCCWADAWPRLLEELGLRR